MHLHAVLTWLIPLVVVVGLPLLVTHQWLRRREKEENAPAWWDTHSMGVKAAAAHSSSSGGGGGGKLVGGSRPPLKIEDCSQCGNSDPAHRCAGCRCVVYCSRACQQKHWTAGHKHECKKLRKQQQLAAREGAMAANALAAGSSRDGSTDGATPEAEGGANERSQESNSTPPVPQQVLYASERYAELAAAPPQRKQPLGLQNVGNSCYANSLLQSLLATPSFAAYLVSGEHSRGCVKPSSSDWCVLCELEKLAVQAYAGGSGSGSKVLNPRPLLHNVKRLGKQFSFGRQEDSHELFLRLMEAVEAVQLLEAGGKARFDLRSRETTLIHHVFAGYTRNQVECLSCGHISRTYECCTSLTLEVGPQVASLEAALKRFAAAERLDGDNKYKCDGCKSLVAAEKSTRLEAAPHCLQICLKRFAPGRFGKITSKLSFPEQLDLGPYMAAGCLDGDPALYSLYAVVVHIDWGRSTDYGHYIAYVKSGGSWFQCDDSTVTPVAAAKALAAGAYLLFYERQAPRRVEAQPAVKAAAAKEPPAAAVAVARGEAEGECGAGAGAVVAGAPAEQQAQQQQAEAEVALERQEEGGGMLRVETAPASLPHMRTAVAPRHISVDGSPGGSPLSGASSGEQLLLSGPREAEAEGIEIGVPEQMHASASESDLAGARQRSAAAAAAAQRPRQLSGSSGARAAPAGRQAVHPRAAAAGPGAAAVGQQASQASHEQEFAAAAAAAHAEVEELRRQQRGPDGHLGCASDDTSDASSTSRFEPSANPYNLLGAEDSGGEAEQGSGSESEGEAKGSCSSSGGGGSSSSRSGGSSREAGSQAAATGEAAEAEQAGKHMLGTAGQPAAASDRAGAGGTDEDSLPLLQQPSSASSHLGAADQKQQAERQHQGIVSSAGSAAAPEAAPQMQRPGCNSCASEAGLQQVEQEQRRERVDDAPKPPVGRAGAVQPPALAQQQQQQQSGAGGAGSKQAAAAAAAASVPSGAGRMQPPPVGKQRQQQKQKQHPAVSGSGTEQMAAVGAGQAATTASAATPLTPQHDACVSVGAGGKRVLRLRVMLPGVTDRRLVDWRLQAGAGGGTTPRQLLVLHAAQYALTLPLPVRVAGDAGDADWPLRGELLTITWPVL